MRSIIFLNRNNLTQAIEISLPQKQKTFSEFFLAFLKWMMVIADVFPEIPSPKNMVR